MASLRSTVSLPNLQLLFATENASAAQPSATPTNHTPLTNHTSPRPPRNPSTPQLVTNPLVSQPTRDAPTPQALGSPLIPELSEMNVFAQSSDNPSSPDLPGQLTPRFGLCEDADALQQYNTHSTLPSAISLHCPLHPLPKMPSLTTLPPSGSAPQPFNDSINDSIILTSFSNNPNPFTITSIVTANLTKPRCIFRNKEDPYLDEREQRASNRAKTLTLDLDESLPVQISILDDSETQTSEFHRQNTLPISLKKDQGHSSIESQKISTSFADIPRSNQNSSTRFLKNSQKISEATTVPSGQPLLSQNPISFRRDAFVTSGDRGTEETPLHSKANNRSNKGSAGRSNGVSAPDWPADSAGSGSMADNTPFVSREKLFFVKTDMIERYTDRFSDLYRD